MPEQERRAEDTGSAISAGERRADDSGGAATAGERRRYNRRRPDVEAAPPYYEIFERIAAALEGIERLARSGSVQPPRPRESSSENAPR